MHTRLLILLFITITIFGCSDNIDDLTKRNEYWVWWIDANSHRGRWIPVKNKEGVQDGEYTKFYYNGQTFKTGRLKNGKQVDTAIYFSLNGKPLSYTFPIGDSIHHYFVKDGYNIQRNQKGKVIGKGFVKDHIFGDQWTTYYDSGNVQIIQNLIHNFGWLTSYYENGNVRDSSYQNGKEKLFVVKSWYENGKIKRIFKYDADYIKASVEEYNKNGVLDARGNIVNGLGEGQTIKYYESGKILAIVNRKHGQLDGYQQSFHENGNIQIEGYMKKNVADGEMKVFAENGKLIKYNFYKNGAIIKNLLVH